MFAVITEGVARLDRIRVGHVIALMGVLLLSVSVLGCTKSARDQVVGTWKTSTTDQVDGHSMKVSAIVDFRSNGTMTLIERNTSGQRVRDESGTWDLLPGGKAIQVDVDPPGNAGLAYLRGAEIVGEGKPVRVWKKQ
jgi:hypothetical protein